MKTLEELLDIFENGMRAISHAYKHDAMHPTLEVNLRPTSGEFHFAILRHETRNEEEWKQIVHASDDCPLTALEQVFENWLELQATKSTDLANRLKAFAGDD
jgi:hypothetical protein